MSGNQDRQQRSTTFLVSSIRTEVSQEDIEKSIEIEENVAGKIIANVSSLYDTRSPVSWERLEMGSKKDDMLSALRSNLNNQEKGQWPAEIVEFFKFKPDVTLVDNVVLVKDGVVIPTSLRPEILEILHAAHQGVTNMMSRATQSVYWPGIKTDIEEKEEIAKVAIQKLCLSRQPHQPLCRCHSFRSR